ncbi:hypothetical protein AMECASPLE_034868 [Ameca splendens]|uniref:Uncharacterized protein n=1 Tax=Ameca splendens TaxID=208324 RepID=A0ABV0YJD0_9TELE
MHFPGLEAVLTFAFIKDVRLELVTGTCRLLAGHVFRQRSPPSFATESRKQSPAVLRRSSALNEAGFPQQASVKRGALLTTVVMVNASDVPQEPIHIRLKPTK